MSYEEEDTCHCQRGPHRVVCAFVCLCHVRRRIHACHMRRRIHVIPRMAYHRVVVAFVCLYVSLSLCAASPRVMFA
jgi:hypothetical protein